VARFRVRPKRTPTDTRAFLLRMAAQGQGGPPERRAIRTEDELKAYYAAHGYDYRREFEYSRKKDAVISLLTVHLDADMFSRMKVNLPPGGSYMAYGNPSEGFVRIQGDSGHIVGTPYLDSFDYAVKNLNRCTGDEEPDYRDLLSAFTSGMASIEAFLNQKMRPRLGGPERDREEALRRTDVETKVFDWLPRLNGGYTVDKGDRPWQDYVKLRHYRNEYHVHPKGQIYGVSSTEFCQRLNLFRTGIARLLLDLHALTGHGAPPELPKYAYWPDIEKVEE
jgi:hypothetical protein